MWEAHSYKVASRPHADLVEASAVQDVGGGNAEPPRRLLGSVYSSLSESINGHHFASVVSSMQDRNALDLSYVAGQGATRPG